MGHHEQTGIRFRHQIQQQPHNRIGTGFIKISCWFIDHQDVRSDRKGPANRHPLLLAT